MADGEGSANGKMTNCDGSLETKTSNYIYFVRPRRNNIRLIQQDVLQQQPLFDKVIREGETIVNGSSHGPERDALQSRLDDSKKRWEEVKDVTETRTDDIDGVYQKSKLFDGSSVTFSCWLMKAETYRNDLLNSPLQADRDMIQQRQKQLEHFKEDLNQNYQLSEDMTSKGKALTDDCETRNVTNGVEHINGHMKELNGRYQDLDTFAGSEKQRILEVGKKLDACQIQLTPIEDLIRTARRTIEEQTLFQDDEAKGKQLVDKIEELKIEFDKEEPHLEQICEEFPRLLKDLGIQVEPVEERFRTVKSDFYKTKSDLYAFYDKALREVSEADNFRIIVNELLLWIPVIREKSQVVKPLDGGWETLNENMQDLEALHKEIVEHRPLLEKARLYADTLIGMNRDDPRACSAINDRLNGISVPLADTMTLLEQRQKKMDKAKEVLSGYEAEKKPFEEFITAASVNIDEMEPFGLDEEKGKCQVEKLNELADEFEKKKQDLRSLNKAGQVLIRHLDIQESFEAEIDKLSDSYYVVFDKVKDKRDETKTNLAKVSQILEIIIEIEVWIQEIHVKLESLSRPTTDPATMKANLEEIQVIRYELARYAPQVTLVYEVTKELLKTNASHKQIVDSITLRVNGIKTPVEENIPGILDERESALQAALSSSLKMQDDVGDLLRWVNKMDVAMKSQSPLSAEESVSKRQATEQAYILEEIARNKPKIDMLTSSSGDDVTDGIPSDALKEISELQEQWKILNELSLKRSAALDEIVPVTVEHEAKKMAFGQWVKTTKPKVDDLDVIAVEEEKLQEQEKAIEELVADVQSHQPDYEKLLEAGDFLTGNCASDIEPVKEVQADAKRDWDDIDGRLKTASSKLVDMKDALQKLDSCLKPVEEACSKTEEGMQNCPKFGTDVDAGRKEAQRLQDLLKEMKDQKPGLDRSHELASAAVAICEEPENVSAMKRRTDVVDQRYDDLLELLEKEAEKTEAAADAAQQYNERTSDISKRMEDLQAKMDRPFDLAADPEKIKRALVEVEELQAEANEIEGLCNEADTLGDEIIQFNNLPAVEESIRSEVEQAKKPLRGIIEKLNNREAALKEQLQRTGAFQDQLEDFSRRLSNFDAKLKELQKEPISTKSAKVADAIKELETFAKDLEQEVPLFANVNNAGNGMLETLESPDDKAKLAEDLKALESTWQKVHDDLGARQKLLTEVHDKAEQLEGSKDQLDKWLGETERKLRDLKPVSCVPSEIDAQKGELNALKSDFGSKQPSFDEISSAVSQLKDLCQEDVDTLMSGFEDTSKNWDDVSTLLKDRQNAIDHMDKRMLDLDNKAKYIGEVIGKVRKASDSLTFAGVGSIGLEEVKDDMSKLKKKLDDLEPNVSAIEAIADELQTYHVQSDVTPVSKRVEGIREEYDNLRKSLDDKFGDAAGAVEDLKNTEARANEVAQQLKDAVQKMDENRPRKLIVEDLIMQAEELKAVESSLEEASPQINEVLRNGNQLLKNGFGDEKLSNNLASITENRRKCNEELPKLAEESQTLGEEVNRLKNGLEELGRDLEEVERKTDALPAIGTDAEAIKQQMEEVKMIRADAARIQSSASDFIGSRDEVVNKHPDCDSSNLYQSVDDLSKRLFDANQKLSDRQGKLEEALVQSGQFGEAVDSLLKWLEETQDIVDGQGPISAADPNVLKAQIMEQKLLSKMFDDRAPSFNSMLKMGKEIIASQPDEEGASKTKEDLEKVTELWNLLNRDVEDRKSKLDGLLPVSQDFLSKLDAASKSVDNLNGNLDEEKWLPRSTEDEIEKQIQDLMDLEKELDCTDGLVEEAVSSSNALMAHCTPEDEEIIKSKLDKLTKERANLKDKQENKLTLLNDTLDLSKLFSSLDKEVNAVFEDVNEKLSENGLGEADIIMALQKQVASLQPSISKLKEIDQKLEKVLPPAEYEKLNEKTSKDLDEYARLKKLTDEKARSILMGKEKVDGFNSDYDALSAWLDDVIERHRGLEPVAVDADVVKEQIKTHQEFLTESAAHETQFKNLYDQSEKLIAASNEEEEASLNEKVESLKHRQAFFNNATSQRQTNLIEALVMAQQFSDVVKEVDSRLNVTEGILQKIDDEKSKGIAVQKEKMKDLQDGIDQLAPLIDTLRETGADLIRLSGPGVASDQVKKQVDEMEDRWDKLSQRVQEKGISIHKAADREEEVQAKADEAMAQLQSLKSHYKSLEPIAVYEEPILRQMEEHQATVAEISSSEKEVEEITASIEHIVKEDATSPVAVSLKEKQRKLNSLVGYLRGAAENRRKSLDDSMDACKKFWPGIEKLQGILKDVGTALDSEEEPRSDPKDIKDLLHEHESIRKDLDSNEDVINMLCQASPVLVGNASQDDKVDVHRQLTEITEQWDTLEGSWSKRKTELEQIYEIAVQFKTEVEVITEWLVVEEQRFADMPPVGTQVGVVKEQLAEMREAYKNLTLKQMEITAMSQKGQTLSERVDAEESDKVLLQVDDVKERWDKLCNLCNERQQKLEEALLDLGQFSIAVEELLTWIQQTKTVLLEKEAPPKDKKAIEIEMAKLKVIRSDVKAHEPSIVICRKAVDGLIRSSANPEEKGNFESKLGELNRGWDEIEALLAERLKVLEEALDKSKQFQSQVREMLGWLNEAKAFLKSKKPTGGRPETAISQVEKHNEFTKVIEERQVTYIYITETLETLIQQTSSISNSRILEKTLNDVKTSWEVVTSLSDNQTVKLQSCLELTMTFSESSKELESWLVTLEDRCQEFDTPAILLEPLENQLSSLREVTEDIDSHRADVAKLKELVVKITETCSSDEAYLLNSDMRKIDDKFKMACAEVKQRKKSLEENKSLAKHFFDISEKVLKKLRDLDDEVKAGSTVGKDKGTVKLQMKQHKELQLSLNALQQPLNAVIKNSNMLQSKGSQEEAVVVEEKENEVMELWDELSKALVARQRQLEEALLFHGMFQDAVQALEDWLSNVEPILSTGTAVMGDVDTVKLLIEQHKRFVNDLNSRKLNFDRIMSIGAQTVKEGLVQEPSSLQRKLDELKLRWDAVTSMSSTKQGRLENALELAKEFQKGTKDTLRRIAEFFDILKAQGPIVDDYEGIKKQIEDFENLQKEIALEESNVSKVLRKGEVILRFCHPNALQIVRHQIALVKRRWADVTAWAKQRETRLREGETVLVTEQTLIDGLMAWIVNEEAALVEVETIPLPDDYDALFRLLEEHKERQQKATAKQPDYDKVVKSAKKVLPDKRRAVRTPGKAHDACTGKEFLNPRISQLAKRWQQLWLNLMDRMKRLQKRLDDIRIKKASADFDWANWKARYRQWLQESKSRVSDLWRRKDKNKDNKLSRQEFVDGILETNFVSERWETELVFGMFEKNGQLDYEDFFNALKEKKAAKTRKPTTAKEQIQHQIETENEKCCCRKRFQAERIGVGKGDDLFYCFGENQKKYLVRILRSNVMVRVGGGWLSLLEFLNKHDPCRAEGKMNFQLRDSLYLPEGASQSMQAFKVKREGSSSGLKPRGVSREPSGDLRSSLSPKTALSGSVRQKSDLERRRSGKPATPQSTDQPGTPSAPKTPSYSNVKGSGYGIRRSTSRESSEAVDGGTAKMKREKSGDILGKSSKAKETTATKARVSTGPGRTRAPSDEATPLSPTRSERGKSTPSASAKRETLKPPAKKSTDGQKSPTLSRRSTTPVSKSSTKK